MEKSHRASNNAAQHASDESLSNAAPSKKRPLSSHKATSSAASPASKKSKPSADPSGGASGSAAQPTTFLEQVEQLGHYPTRFKKPRTDKERLENSLADKISKQWSKLSDATQAELARIQEETKSKEAEAQAQDILENVKQLGHYPQRFKKPANDKERAENSLADKKSNGRS